MQKDCNKAVLYSCCRIAGSCLSPDLQIHSLLQSSHFLGFLLYTSMAPCGELQLNLLFLLGVAPGSEQKAFTPCKST